MSSAVPPRALQRMEALDRANDIRHHRALLKMRIKEGSESVPSLLADPPDWLLTMKVWELLLAQRKWGMVKVSRLFKTMGMSPSKTVGGLSTRQRVELIDELQRRVRR